MRDHPLHGGPKCMHGRCGPIGTHDAPDRETSWDVLSFQGIENTIVCGENVDGEIEVVLTSPTVSAIRAGVDGDLISLDNIARLRLVPLYFRISLPFGSAAVYHTRSFLIIIR
jgi:hypothetical protein